MRGECRPLRAPVRRSLRGAAGCLRAFFVEHRRCPFACRTVPGGNPRCRRDRVFRAAQPPQSRTRRQHSLRGQRSAAPPTWRRGRTSGRPAPIRCGARPTRGRLRSRPKRVASGAAGAAGQQRTPRGPRITICVRMWAPTRSPGSVAGGLPSRRKPTFSDQCV